MMTVGLVLSLPRLSMGRHIGPSELAAVGVLVLLTTGVVSPADLVGSFHVLWRPFVAVLSIMLTTNVALRFGTSTTSPGCLSLGRGSRSSSSSASSLFSAQPRQRC